ncbi:MAG TPA: GGDEF domain-containing protein, partial [Actinomycetales bacterium]
MPSASSVRVGFAAVGTLSVLVFAAHLSPGLSMAAFVVLGAATCAALFLGPVLNHVDRRPWAMIAVSAVLFAVGAGVRPLTDGAQGLLVGLPDAFLLPGYLIAGAGLVLLLRRRDGMGDVHASTDTLIVLVGAVSLALTLVVVPAMEVPGRPLWVSVLSATYPVLDVLVLCALVQLSFTTRGSSWSLRFLIASISLLLTGDACYAYLSTQGTLVAPHAVDVVYSFSFLLLGASALHPSVGSLAVGRRRRLQSWSLPRVLMVVPSMTAPVVLLSLTDDRSPLLRALLAGLAVVAIGLLVTRAMVAVRALGRLQRATAHEATHDSLTGLPNRVHLDAWLARQLQRGRQLSVLFLDLDGFKLVNDSFGHAAGDELLEAVAARLRRVTPSDAVLARLGGDEFVMAQVVGGEGRAGSSAHELAGELAEAMLGAIAQPFVLS